MHDQKKLTVFALAALLLGLGRTAQAQSPESPAASPAASQPATRADVPVPNQTELMTGPRDGASQSPEGAPAEPPKTEPQQQQGTEKPAPADAEEKKAEAQTWQQGDDGSLTEPLGGSISITPPDGWTPSDEAAPEGAAQPIFNLANSQAEGARIQVYVTKRDELRPPIALLAENGQQAESTDEVEGEMTFRNGERAGKAVTLFLNDSEVTVVGIWSPEQKEIEEDFNSIVESIVITK